MGMPEAVHRWTREEVLALPDDGNRYELVNGELLVPPAPSAIHQEAVLTLYRHIHPYVSPRHLGHVMLSPADLDLGRGQSVQPDLLVVPLVGGRKPLDWRQYGVPLLIAEVSSPSTARYIRGIKRKEYQEAGVADYLDRGRGRPGRGALAAGRRAARDPRDFTRVAARRRLRAAGD